MLDPKDIAYFDQTSAMIAEIFPPALKQLYDGLIAEGFSVAQAERFTEVWLKMVLSYDGIDFDDSDADED